jgi:hypothetical protein
MHVGYVKYETKESF